MKFIPYQINLILLSEPFFGTWILTSIKQVWVHAKFFSLKAIFLAFRHPIWLHLLSNPAPTTSNLFNLLGASNLIPVFVARVGSGQVRLLWFGFEFWKFPLKMSNFSIFFPSGQKKMLPVGSESTRVKAGSASYLLRVKSKLGLGWVGSCLVGSGPISNPHYPNLLTLKSTFELFINIQKFKLDSPQTLCLV